jgi:hypothetical protein
MRSQEFSGSIESFEEVNKKGGIHTLSILNFINLNILLWGRKKCKLYKK